MKENYSIEEILKAVKELSNLKKEKIDDKIISNRTTNKKKIDIPINTLRLIEEAEKKIQIKTQLK